MYHYSAPPPGYVRYTYDTTPTSSPSNSPSPDDRYQYYVPQYKPTPTTPDARRHSRKESYCPGAPAGWHSPAGYPSPSYYATMPNYWSPPAHQSNNSGHVKEKARRFSQSGHHRGGNHKRRVSEQQSPPQPILVDTSDEAYDSPPPVYIHVKPRTPAAGHHPLPREKYAKADAQVFYNQVPVRADDYDSQPQRSRARRSSPPPKPRPNPTPTKPAKVVSPSREATAADAAKVGIPAGYSIKNWDPTEAPVLLLGSVFDANSLGKWIYDWTVFHHGSSSPMSEVAGDLWLLLIKLAGKMKRADECLPRIRAPDNQEMVEDFLESGDRLWGRFKRLLKACEEFMWKAAKREGSKGSIKMGKNSGCEFVDSIFGRDRELEKTESLMQSIRLWNIRFDANCEDILRRPSAA
ncbi:MAG: hypothetical protein LQ348_007527 [Seirophora lacunosa]|nr:MAG: hypothetical protein LQ348_007527 [Seirophora lacunosa]